MSDFQKRTLPEAIKREMIALKTWQPECPVPLERLMLLTLNHHTFEGEIKEGELVVLDVLAEATLKIFQELFVRGFPFARMERIEKYQGDDTLSQEANNTSCFNYRPIAGTSKISLHGYGAAIDINPWQNPYLRGSDSLKDHLIYTPSKGKEYLNRKFVRKGMAEEMGDIFKQNGFPIWGGDWHEILDWQHFQISRAAAELLAVMQFEEGSIFYQKYTKNPHLLDQIPCKGETWSEFYQENPSKFKDWLEKI